MMQYRHVDELIQAYEMKREAIERRLREFKNVPPEKYFYELLYCLMTPQSSAVNAGKAQTAFELADFKNKEINPEPILSDKNHYIRFHKTKSKWIMEMKKQFPSIVTMISDKLSGVEKREWLAANVLGLSYKEATHFLRNIGLNEGLTILDRHILKNLRYHGIIRLLPKTISKKIYMQIESKFMQFSSSVGISTDKLDLVFWSKEAGEILK